MWRSLCAKRCAGREYRLRVMPANPNGTEKSSPLPRNARAPSILQTETSMLWAGAPTHYTSPRQVTTSAPCAYQRGKHMTNKNDQTDIINEWEWLFLFVALLFFLAFLGELTSRWSKMAPDMNGDQIRSDLTQRPEATDAWTFRHRRVNISSVSFHGLPADPCLTLCCLQLILSVKSQFFQFGSS